MQHCCIFGLGRLGSFCMYLVWGGRGGGCLEHCVLWAVGVSKEQDTPTSFPYTYQQPYVLVSCQRKLNLDMTENQSFGSRRPINIFILNWVGDINKHPAIKTPSRDCAWGDRSGQRKGVTNAEPATQKAFVCNRVGEKNLFVLSLMLYKESWDVCFYSVFNVWHPSPFSLFQFWKNDTGAAPDSQM